MCIPSGSFHCDSPSPGNGDVPHREFTSSPGMGMCLTGNAHSHQEWGCASPRMGMCFTGNAHSHREWGCASIRMHILTGNAHSLHRVSHTLHKLSSVTVRICSTCEEDHQYQWVSILSTREHIQYPWVTLFEWKMNEVSLTGIAYPHGYRRSSSQVLWVCLTGINDLPQRYCEYVSRALMIFLMGSGYPHGHCVSSRVCAFT